MKLEPKHIIKHLPYKPMVEILDYKCDYVGKQYDEIIGVHQWDSKGEFWCVFTAGGSKPDINKIKLALHPLSDLTKPITHKDETFVPMDILRKYLVEIDGNSFGLLYNGFVGDEVFKTHTFQYAGNSNISLLAMPYHFVEQLLEWHFDIDNLIGHGLAVDINTLK